MQNPDDPEGAAARFREAQHAYEVLFDPHERRWYDSHRDMLLKAARKREGAGEEEEEEDQETLNLMSYFTPNCFREFDDSEQGFFTVYAAAFATILSKEPKSTREAFPGLFHNLSCTLP